MADIWVRIRRNVSAISTVDYVESRLIHEDIIKTFRKVLYRELGKVGTPTERLRRLRKNERQNPQKWEHKGHERDGKQQK